MTSADGQAGFWINYLDPRGPVLGASLTLSAFDSGFLISTASFFITIVAGSAWVLASFVLHQIFVGKYGSVLNEGWLHELHALLRNSETASPTAWELVLLGYQWRRHGGRRMWPILVSFIAALLIAAGFTAASVFSARVASVQNSNAYVRAKKNNCGIYDPIIINGTAAATAAATALGTLGLRETQAARTYAETCYNSSTVSPTCNTFVVPEIPSSLTNNVPCPFFNQSVCFDGTAAPIRLDSGKINSGTILGIDTMFADRVEYRKVATCAIVTIAPWEVRTNGDGILSAEKDTTFQYFLGPLLPQTNTSLEFTFEYDLHVISNGIGYQLSSIIASPVIWNPIPAFTPADDSGGGVSLHFLAQNDVTYSQPVLDPWFSAQKKGQISGRYSWDYVVDTVGCVEQMQFCNPSNGMCTNLTSYGRLLSEISNIGLNSNQNVTALYIYLNDLNNNIYEAVAGLGSNALIAQTYLYFQLLNYGTLPDDQWKREVSLWFHTTLAKLQSRMVQFVSKDLSSLPDGYEFLSATLDPNFAWLCDIQLIQNTGQYRTFSFIGLMIILVVGLLFIVMGFLIPRSFRCCRSVTKQTARDWDLHSLMQILRLLYHSRGFRLWQNERDAFPTTYVLLPSVRQIDQGSETTALRLMSLTANESAAPDLPTTNGSAS